MEITKPELMKQGDFELICREYRLIGRSWKPDHPRGLVVLVHGMGEHSGRYMSSLLPEFLAAGLAVYATDHFGHGQSEGKRGHAPGYEAVLDSIDVTLEKARADFPELPIFLYGHSMGGNAVLGFAMKRKPRIAGVLSTSPFLEMAFSPPAWKMAMGRVLSSVMPSVTMPSGLNPEHISRDPLEVSSYISDPLNHDKISPNFVFPFLEAAKWMEAHPQEMELPVFLCHGTGDLITSYKATKRLSEAISHAELELFEGGYHELHNDLNRERLYRLVLKWIDKKILK